ncbi:MAG: hypothetical protein AAGG51_28240 [Cyanobacteria bacterium P01_G01_bin.54]
MGGSAIEQPDAIPELTETMTLPSILLMSTKTSGWWALPTLRLPCH